MARVRSLTASHAYGTLSSFAGSDNAGAENTGREYEGPDTHVYQTLILHCRRRFVSTQVRFGVIVAEVPFGHSHHFASYAVTTMGNGCLCCVETQYTSRL